QNEKDRTLHLRAARAGAWVELDGIAEDSRDTHVTAVMDLAHAGYLERVLISQDAGWYHVGEPGGGRFRPYTFLFDGFLPALRRAGLGERDVRTLLVDNPHGSSGGIHLQHEVGELLARRDQELVRDLRRDVDDVARGERLLLAALDRRPAHLVGLGRLRAHDFSPVHQRRLPARHHEQV